MSWLPFALICMIMTVAKTLLAKRLLRDIEPQVFVFLDLAFSWFFLLAFLPWFQWQAVTPRFMLLIGLIAVPSILAMTFLSKATKEGEISEVSPLLLLVPAITALTTPIFLDENISSLGWAGILTVLMGGYLIKLEDPRNPLGPFRALRNDRVLRFVIISIGIGVVGIHLSKLLVLSTDPVTTQIATQTTLTFLALPLGLWWGRGTRGLRRTIQDHYKLLIILGAISTVSSLSILTALHLGGQIPYVLSIKRMSVIFIAGLGMFAMKESVRTGKILGVGCMVAGGYILFQN